MSALLIASITQLCTPDHRGDAGTIAAWTANKTPEGVAAMLADPATRLFVAERDGRIAAVGSVRDDCEVTLNYVHPAHRFAGVSRALLVAMESHMARQGHRARNPQEHDHRPSLLPGTGLAGYGTTLYRALHRRLPDGEAAGPGGWMTVGRRPRKLPRAGYSALCRCTMSSQRSNL
ncbi:MAG: GNAT family N-acetyltransferase [Devosia sp.]|nr:GNAT family N-acetyltransferase [Devosia sp.]